MEFVFVKQDSAEWLYMWLWLELEIVEHDVEVWQYVGSYRQNEKTVHEFKHIKTAKIISVEASKTFTDNQIEKILKINKK